MNNNERSEGVTGESEKSASCERERVPVFSIVKVKKLGFTVLTKLFK